MSAEWYLQDAKRCVRFELGSGPTARVLEGRDVLVSDVMREDMSWWLSMEQRPALSNEAMQRAGFDQFAKRLRESWQTWRDVGWAVITDDDFEAFIAEESLRCAESVENFDDLDANLEAAELELAELLRAVKALRKRVAKSKAAEDAGEPLASDDDESDDDDNNDESEG